MKITAEPRSDQYNADDLVGGPRTFTIAGVRAGTAEQKYDLMLEGEQRVWRPPLTVLRLLIAAWGADGEAWTGQRVTLYRDPSIRFGKDEVGGIRVSHVSGITKPLTVALTATRGKRASHTVQPLPDLDPTTAEVQRLRAEWRRATPERQAEIQARVAELTAPPPVDVTDAVVLPDVETDAWPESETGA